jgi:hypothetical protein
MAGGPDPMGKRALYWLPVDELAVTGEGADDASSRSRGTDPGRFDPRSPHARPAGKHALFSSATPAGDEESADSSQVDPLPQRGMFVITCSSCGSVSRTTLFDVILLNLPFGVWVPLRTFSRWMTCPACRRRSWTRVTLAR